VPGEKNYQKIIVPNNSARTVYVIYSTYKYNKIYTRTL